MNQRIPTMPSDLDAEEAVIGCCLLDRNAYNLLSGSLRPEDFYRAAHGYIWRAMGNLALRGEPTDVLLLKSELERLGILEEVGGAGALLSLTSRVPMSTYGPHYAGLVARAASQRRLMSAGAEITRLAYESDDPDAAIAQAEDLLLSVQRERGQGKVMSPQQQAEVMLTFLADVKTGTGRGLATGLTELDEYLGGLYPGEFVLVAARPAIGKSTLLQTMAENLADAGNVVLYCTIEMPLVQVRQRSLAWRARMNVFRVRTGQFDEYEADKLSRAIGDLAEQPLYVYDSADMTPASIRSEATRLQLKHGLAAIFVDYIQILNPDRPGESSVQTYTEISKQLRRTARALDVPLVAASQLNRESEKGGGRPTLAQLRETGALEQDANVVLLLHRDRQTLDDFKAGRPSHTNCEIAKNRQGQSGTDVQLLFLPKMTRYVDRDWSDAK